MTTRMRSATATLSSPPSRCSAAAAPSSESAAGDDGSGGGATLLKDPELIYQGAKAMRDAVPAHLPVSAKMRLGFNDTGLMRECAQAMQAGGAAELVVHARTKADGYRPPAYWEHIPTIRAAVSIPVVANGEIWTVADAQRCREVSGCDALMLGRGIVADPGLARAIRAADAGRPDSDTVVWADLVPHLAAFWQLVCDDLEAGLLVAPLGFVPDGTGYHLLAPARPEPGSAHETLANWLHSLS